MSFAERLLVVAIRIAFYRHGGRIERLAIEALRDVPEDEWGTDLDAEMCQ